MLKKLEVFGLKNTDLIRSDVEEEEDQEDEAVETHSSKSTRSIKVGQLLMHTPTCCSTQYAYKHC